MNLPPCISFLESYLTSLQSQKKELQKQYKRDDYAKIDKRYQEVVRRKLQVEAMIENEQLSEEAYKAGLVALKKIDAELIGAYKLC